MLESAYQTRLIDTLYKRFPGCYIVLKPVSFVQGTPDLLILFGRQWAMLEVKASAKSTIQPNQPYYVELFDAMSFAAFIYPENEEEILNELAHAFESGR